MSSPVSLQRVASTVVPSDISECGRDEHVAKLPPLTELEILFDVKPFSEAVRNDVRSQFLVDQVRQIGAQAFWGNNCLEDCTSRQGWRLNIAAEPASHGDEVLGFIVYKIDPRNKLLHIQYLAVAANHRRHGIGSKLMKSLQNYATKTLTNSMVDRIACACVPEAVSFYKKHHFQKIRRIVPDPSEESSSTEKQIPLQYQMEWRVPKRKK